MTVGAVVVSYRDPGDLERCLRSLETVQHVVVVNITGDAAVSAVVGRYRRQELAIEENVGYAAGVNRGVGALPPAVDTVLFMNDDVELVGDVPSVDDGGVIVPLQRGAPDLQFLPTPVGFVRGWILARRPPRLGPGQVVSGARSANGAALIASRQLLEQVPLPEEYFMYWEETAWFWRLSDVGTRVVIGAVGVERSGGAEEWDLLKARLLGENLIRLANERYGRTGLLIYTVLGMAWVLRLLVTDVVKGRAARRRSSRLATVRGLVAAGFDNLRDGRTA